VELLTDGTEKNPILGFCLSMISQHGENWPPEEEVLAKEFVNWLGFRPFVTRSRLKELCQSKGVDLSFASLPDDIRGFNCLFQDKKEIVITEREPIIFSDAHTLLHEFREILEHVFIELRHPTIGSEDCTEVQAELFAGLCRIDAGAKELPAALEMAQQIEKKWARYLGYVAVAGFTLVYLFTCIYMRQLEEIDSEVERQRYVRT
jgi:hypothetical protein